MWKRRTESREVGSKGMFADEGTNVELMVGLLESAFVGGWQMSCLCAQYSGRELETRV